MRYLAFTCICAIPIIAGVIPSLGGLLQDAKTLSTYKLTKQVGTFPTDQLDHKTGNSANTELHFRKPINDGPMLRMMDGLNKILSGGREFDRRTFRKIRSCMAYFGDDNARVQDAAWQGMIDYWNRDNVGTDLWGKSPSNLKECNVSTLLSVDNMEVYEPCSSASNFAYYFSLMEICQHQVGGEKLKLPSEYLRAIGVSISSMAMASTFLHASNTKLGHDQDLAVISTIVYTAYQASLAAVPYSAVLHDLSVTPRNLSSVQMAAALQHMYLTQPASQWMQVTNDLQLPRAYFIIAIKALNLMAMVIGYKQATWITTKVLPSFPLEDEDKFFISNHYLHEMQRLEVYHRSDDRKLKKKAVGFIFKFFQAILYHEHVIKKILLRHPKIVMFLNFFNQQITRILNSVIKNEYKLKELRDSKNIYPNEVICNSKSPHARWHVLSAQFLVDLVLLSDELYSSSLKHSS